VYGYLWLVPVQDVFAFVYNTILDVTQPGTKHSNPTIDSKLHFTILNYQILKHAFRLSWYYLADYFYNYRKEEKQRIELAVSNRELQLKLLKWHLNPEFYFKTIGYLKKEAAERPANAGQPILQLAKVMEYVIYDARQPQVEMGKEAQFLSNYIQLVNQQLPTGNKILFTYEKEENRLLITPLLLAGLVEGIVIGKEENATQAIVITIRFNGNQLLFSVTGLHTPPVHQALLDELYAGRYTSVFTLQQGYKLTIHLDAS
jgi:Histidine kinase